MYCNQCGTQAQENQRFCTKCGKELTKHADRVCPSCNAQVEPEASFCNACGTPIPAASVPNEKQFCPYCGTNYQPKEDYCKECGHAIGEKKQEEAKAFEPLEQDDAPLFQKPSFLSGGGAKTLAIQHLVTAGLFVLLILFWFLPAISIEIPVFSLFDSNMQKMSISMGNPLGDEGVQELLLSEMQASELEATKIIWGFLIFLFDVIPFSLAAVFCALPLWKGSLKKRRRFILQKIVSIRAFLGILLTLLIYKLSVSEAQSSFSKNVATAHLTFGGWLLILFTLGLTVWLFYLSYQNKKLFGNEPKERRNLPWENDL